MIKYIFFLIIPLLIIIPSAYGEAGRNYDTTINPDGSTTWISHFERLIDQNWNWVDTIKYEDASSISIETAYGSVRLDKNTCEFSLYAPGAIFGAPLLTDSIEAQRATVATEDWIGIPQINGAPCIASENGNTLVATRLHTTGIMEYKYIFSNGKWKTQLEATNNSILIDQKFGFNQTFDINSDSVRYGGSLRNLDNFDGQSFDRSYLELNQAKVIDLLTGHKFDFDLGFDTLESVSVFDTGPGTSRLVFAYTHDANVLLPGEKLIVDPTYSYTVSSFETEVLAAATTGVACGATPYVFGGNLHMYLGNSGISDNCYRSAFEWDVSSIPDSATITDTGIRYDIIVVTTGTRTCDYTSIENQPSVSGAEDLWNDIGNGTVFVSADTDCQGVANNYVLDLGVSSDADLQANLVNLEDWWAVGAKFTDETRTGAVHNSQFRLADIELTATYISTTVHAVTDLAIDETRSTGVTLSWTAPSSTVPITGYQVNYTTPHNGEKVNTVFRDDTGSTSTTINVSPLTGSTDYSFRVGARTAFNLNATSNIVNTTTLFDQTVSFTPGTFNFTDVGTDIRDIRFELTEISSTSKRLNVTYPTTFSNLRCDLDYEFAGTNRTYSGLAAIPAEPGFEEISFLFTDVNNEIITAFCWEDTTANATYVITQTSIPFVEQIKDFQGGAFGTSGDFGSLDLIALLVFGAVATIGFNSKNETVGAVFLFALTFGLAWFEIITLPTAMGGIIAVVILLVVVTTRKD